MLFTLQQDRKYALRSPLALLGYEKRVGIKNKNSLK
jgi:hypothetical protein